jgi:threonylcarbamoyladenosine tRNA methylthiotransferase MtaB
VPGFYVENFGCRATQADGAAIERQFEERGFGRSVVPSQAEIVVLNTCTVTAAADQDARAAIRRVRRQNPKAKIVVTGCYAQRASEEIAALPGVSCVIGNSHKHQLAEIALQHGVASQEKGSQEEAAEPRIDSTFLPLTSLTGNRNLGAEERVFVSDIFAHTELLAAPVFDASHERTRPNLKVQDGCDNRCSFCVIPYVRGQSRSMPLDQVLHEVDTLVSAGYREVVVSGINLGRWGRDLTVGAGDKRARKVRQPVFEDLIRAILERTSLEKLRISSVEPMDWSDELIALVAESPRIAKHAHIPMQSGSDAVLRRMHRKYRPWHYREKVEKIRAAMPIAGIGADVMTGFPGESDAEFEATRRMVEDSPLTYLHVFTYSARPGTPAADMPSQVPVNVARERNRILRELAAEKKRAFMRGFVGKTIAAITLGSSGSGDLGKDPSATGSSGTLATALERTSENAIPVSAFTEALTDNYLKLRLKGQHQANRWMYLQVHAVESEALVATLG